jgi:iron complex outermembrane receptor protein
VTSGMLLLSGLVGLGLLAQEPPVDLIIITGDRAGEPAAETPLAVSVLDADEIDHLGAHHPAELVNRAPGVSLQRGNGGEHLTAIRSPVLTGGAGAGSFLFLEDGIPLRAAGFSNVNGLFEALPELAERVEIIRGPGPALYGSNAMHGLINIASRTGHATGAELDLELGSFGRHRGRLAWADEGEELRTSLALSTRHEDGWRDEASLDRIGAQLSVAGQAGPAEWRLTSSVVSLNQETAGFVRGSEAYRDLALARANDDAEAFRDAIAWRAALHLTGQSSERWSWRLIPYARANAMEFLMHFVPSEALEESGHVSAGILVSGTRQGRDSRITLGLDLDQTRGELQETQDRPTIFSFVQGQHYDYSVDSSMAAVYAQARWFPVERLSLEAGLRYETTRYSYDNRIGDGALGRFLRQADREDEFETITPNVGFVRQMARGQFFGRLARGIRAPQTAELYRLQTGQVITSIDPEELDSLEIGYRGELGSIERVEISVYGMRKRNVFFRDADGLNVTDGRTRHHGVEFFAEHAIGSQFSLDISGSWARHMYDFDRVVASATETILRGNDIDTAPRWTAALALNWRPSNRWLVRTDWSHVGRYFTDAANDHTYPGHDIIGVRFRYSMSERVEIYGHVRNLMDARYAERADFAFGSERYFPGEERGVSLGIRVRR